MFDVRARYSGLALLSLVILLSGPVFAQNPERDAPAMPAVWENVKVVDVHRWEYVGVTLRWVGAGEAMQLTRPDGATRNFAPDEILWVTDADGQDITAAVAAARHSGSQPAIESAAPEFSDRDNVEVGGSPPLGRATLDEIISPRLFDIALNFGGGYATHAGDWFLGLDDGLNYQGGFSVMIGPRSYLHANYRHQDLGRQVFYFDEYSPTIEVETFLREYQLYLGRHAPLVNKNGVRSVGYLEVGISVMDHHIRIAHEANSGSLTKMGLALQAGALALLTDVLALDFSAGGTWKPGTSSNESGGLLIGGHLGLRILY